MQTHIIGRAVALVAGVIATGLALGILLEDVLFGSARFELKHAIVIGTVALAIFSLHLVGEAWHGRHWFAVLGFSVLFVAATALVVFKSTGQQAGHVVQSQAEADYAADERARIKPLLARAQAMLSETMDKLQADCVNGRRSKAHCDGLRTTRDVYDAAVKGHVASLADLGPPKPVAPEADNFAAVASVFGADKARVKAGSVLLVPFIQTALLEFGSIWCLSFAFRPWPRRATVAERRPVNPSEQSDFCTDDIDEARKLGIGGEPGTGNWGNPRNGGGARVFSRAEALLDLTRRLASGETVDAQNDLATAWGIDKSTVSKWVKQWRADGLIPAAQRIGRCHRLVAAS
jgi:hypothetical protein